MSDEKRQPPALEILDGGGSSLLEAVDSLLNRGVLLEGDLVLGLADVDLVYLRLTTLLAAADRILGKAGTRPPAPPEGGDRPETHGGEHLASSVAIATRGVGEELASSRVERPTGAQPLSYPDRSEPSGKEAEHTRRAETHPTVAGVDELRDEIERTLGGEPDRPTPPRWNAAPEDVERSVARLVLALVEFLRKLMERQAIRRMEEGTLTEEQVERLGQALMRLEETVHDMARRFGLSPEDLNLDLGPLGHLT